MNEAGWDHVTEDGSIAAAVPASALAAASNVLVVGPSRDVVRGVPAALLDAVASDGDGLVAVQTSESAGATVDRLRRTVDGVAPERLAVVDATPKDAAVRSNPRPLYWALPSPMDLTGSTVAVHECLDSLFERGVDARHVCVDSISRLLLGGDRDAVARYVHQLVAVTSAPDALGVYPMYANSTDGDARAALTHLFDGVVELRRNGSDRELRCRGLEDAASDWVDVEPPAPDRVGGVDVH